MPRNSDNVRGRLQQTALELYRDRGYDRTTAADIAERVGVTERTFFRHFRDKREVLFDGEAALNDALVEAIAAAPAELGMLDVLRQAFRSVETMIEENRPFSEPRRVVIADTPALQERELTKIASQTKVLASSLRDRGIADRMASVAAQLGMTAFANAANTWLDASKGSFGDNLDEAFNEIRTIASGW